MGTRKWVRIINIYIYTQVVTCLNEKKEVRQVNQKLFEFLKGEYRDGQHAKETR